MKKNSRQIYEIERNVIFEGVMRRKIPIMVRSGVDFVEIGSSSMKIMDYKVILIQNPPAALLSLVGDDVDFSFVYNSVQYSFKSTLKQCSLGVALVMPDCLDAEPGGSGSGEAFAVELFFEAEEVSKNGIVFKNKRSVDCRVRSDIMAALDCARPDWRERLASLCFSEPFAGDALVPDVVFLSCEKIVFAFQKRLFDANEGEEFAAWLRFPLKRPLNERKIYVSFVVEKVVRVGDCEKSCVFGKFSGIKLEDLRFLDEYFS